MEEKVKYDFHVSYSRITVFKTCAGQYYDRYVLKNAWSDKKWPATVFGDAMHKTVETIIEWLQQNTPIKEIHKRLDTFFSETFFAFQAEYKAKKIWAVSRDYDEVKMLKVGTDFSFYLYELIEQYYQEYILVSEHNFQTLYTDIKGLTIDLSGRVDLMLFKDDIIHGVGDFKTTKDSNQYFFVDWDSCIQKLIYEYMIFMKYASMPTIFKYMVVNHTNRTLFVKETKNNLRNFSFDTHFKYLFDIIKDISEIHKCDIPDIYKPEKEKCHWCERSKTCPRKYISPITAKMQKAMLKKKR